MLSTSFIYSFSYFADSDYYTTYNELIIIIFYWFGYQAVYNIITISSTFTIKVIYTLNITHNQ